MQAFSLSSCFGLPKVIQGRVELYPRVRDTRANVSGKLVLKSSKKKAHVTSCVQEESLSRAQRTQKRAIQHYERRNKQGNI